MADLVDEGGFVGAEATPGGPELQKHNLSFDGFVGEFFASCCGGVEARRGLFILGTSKGAKRRKDQRGGKRYSDYEGSRHDSGNLPQRARRGSIPLLMPCADIRTSGGQPDDLSLLGKSAVDGKGAGALDDDGQGDGHHHVASDAESGDAAEQAKKQADAAEEFGADGQEGERRGDVHDLGEETHGAGESIAAEPAEGLLRAVREEDHAKDEAKDGHDWITGGVDELAEHEHALLCVQWKNG